MAAKTLTGQDAPELTTDEPLDGSGHEVGEPTPTPAAYAAYIAGKTVEQVIRELAASPDADPLPVIQALVVRYDAKAARRASKAAAAE